MASQLESTIQKQIKYRQEHERWISIEPIRDDVEHFFNEKMSYARMLEGSDADGEVENGLHPNFATFLALPSVCEAIQNISDPEEVEKALASANRDIEHDFDGWAQTIKDHLQSLLDDEHCHIDLTFPADLFVCKACGPRGTFGMTIKQIYRHECIQWRRDSNNFHESFKRTHKQVPRAYDPALIGVSRNKVWVRIQCGSSL